MVIELREAGDMVAKIGDGINSALALATTEAVPLASLARRQPSLRRLMRMQDKVCRLERIIGDRVEPEIAARLHNLAHDGVSELLTIAVADLPRRRFRAVTDYGTECAVALPRDAKLFDGAVLLLGTHRAIVVKVGAENWLKLRPAEGFALELGYLAGNLHWKVRFADELLLVAVDGPIERYLNRVAEHLAAGRVSVVEDIGAAVG